MKNSSHFQDIFAKFALVIILVAVCRVSSLDTVTTEGDVTGYRLFPSNNRWYRLHSEQLEWAAAEGTCVEEGGHLAMPSTAEESSFLKTLMQERLPAKHSTTVLLGFSRRADGKFTTLYGSTLEGSSFEPWSNSSGPVVLGLKGGNCGSLHSDGGLNRISCNFPAPFICQRDNNENVIDSSTTETATTETTPTTTISTTTIPPQPAPGYEYLTNLGWYKIYPKKTWHEGLKVCEEDHAHLAIVNSGQEASALSRLISRSNRRINFGICNCAFIGFHDLSKEGNFTTVFGEPLESTGYVKWNANNPDNTGNNEDCGSITYHGLLNDLSCVEEYPFICESSSDTHTYNPNFMKNVTEPSGNYQTFPGVGSYKLHTEGMRWYDALNECELEGAYLAIINSDLESEVLRKIIGRNPDLELGKGNAVFLGFHDIPKKEDFTTIFGESLNTTGFTKWESKVSTNFDCGALTRSGRLTLLNCFSSAPFICETLTITEKQKVTISQKEAMSASNQDYEFYGGLGYYKLHLDKASWYRAKLRCEKEHAHLAIINSDEESKLLRDIASRNQHIKQHSSILLGFHDISTEGRFVTIYGTPIESSGFSKWREGSPDNLDEEEDCGAMDINGLLNDVPCNLRLEYFCERDLNATTTAFESTNARRMRITPEHVHVRQGGHVSIICEAPEPLIECHFKMSPRPIMDLSRGSASKTNSSLLDSEGLTNYRYNGSGLENGQCGIVLSLGTGLHRTIVGCRGRGLRGGWYYAYMSLHASNAPAIRNVQSPPKEIVTFEGQPLKIKWTAPTPIRMCKCIFPKINMEVHLMGPNLTEMEYDYYDDSEEEEVVSTNEFISKVHKSLFSGAQYNGNGYNSGDCGVSILSQKSSSGFLWCGIGSELSFEWRSVAIIVVKPPSPPELIFNAVEHSEGAILEAECRVSGSVPTPNITWYLGDEIIRQDLIDDLPTTTWSWPFDEEIITQRLTRQLRLDDRGKELICEAANPYSPTEPVRTRKMINLAGSVLNRSFDVEEYGFEVGKPGFIVITITASPRPETTWHFDNIIIPEGKLDTTGRFAATLAPKRASLNIQWVAKLFISNVTEEDFSRDFHLTAKNSLGAQAYRVVIVRARWTTTTTTTTTTTPTPTPTPTTPTPTTATSTASTYWSTSGSREATAAVTSGPLDTTAGPTVYEGAAVKTENTSGWSTGGAISGVLLVLLLLTLTAVVVYGRKVGWSFLPPRARRHFGPALSMDNLINEEDADR